ncbi:MAG: ornithine aminomutase subunit alpha [Defluviitaleaceae bacterium]|nr:ornithine aminomutase subunit alpha [Defluviitaleaceae bacterium]MCL2239927.1 ornithine aminomutase subunit alpha [Defluviitaleaceae bacterium]
MKRNDDFSTRRAHLADLTDAQLHERFWQLAAQIVDPLLKLGRENTSPAIERSVLLRMGFSSLEVKEIVDGAHKRGLLGHGAGHVVYKLAKAKDIPLRDAGLMLAQNKGWEEATALFKGGN